MLQLCCAKYRSFVIVLLLASLPFVLAQTAPQLPSPSSPGATIQAAAKAAARDSEKKSSVVDILSDTQGVDFNPYLQTTLEKIRKNWYRMIPESAQMKKGHAAIEFAVMKDGQTADMRFAATSGDTSLDRAAWDGVTASEPFPALPAEFHGPNLTLRLHFYYNTDLAEHRFTHAILIENSAAAHTPKYPQKALESKTDGMARIEAKVDPSGNVNDVSILEGDTTLAEASSAAIRKWHFHPAQRDGVSIEDTVRINVVFRLDGAQVTAKVVWPEPVSSAKPTQ
jgi:TonB family protein